MSYNTFKGTHIHPIQTTTEREQVSVWMVSENWVANNNSKIHTKHEKLDSYKSKICIKTPNSNKHVGIEIGIDRHIDGERQN